VVEMPIHCAAVLGRKDEPTDAVQEYCRFLAAAVARVRLSAEHVIPPYGEKKWGVNLLVFLKCRKWTAF
jgi:hypothetical protein